MRLRDALGIQRGDVVAFTGAGGKTSALFRLARELQDDGWRVLATTTTRLASEEVRRAPFAAQMTPDITPAMLREWLNQHGFVFLYSRQDRRYGKTIGLHPDAIPRLVDSVNSDVLLIEADGARQLPLKAPYDHEPVIPPDASLVVPVVGMDVLGQPLDGAHVYNATRILTRYGLREGAGVIPAWVALVLRDPELGLRGVSDSVRVVPLLNKVPPKGYARARARRTAQLTLRSARIEAVAVGEMLGSGEPVHEVQRRVAAVVLAAGVSTRMGQSKALLAWDGRTVIEAIVNRLLVARMTDVVVVTGYRGNDVAQALRDLPIQIIHNPAYAQGEMLSSLQVGLRSLADTIAASLVVMGDQPSLDPRVIRRVLAAYAEQKRAIVVPAYRGQRGHPVLFDRRFWPELMALASGAPRDVVNRHPDQVAVVEVSTDSILRDIDTPAKYRMERWRAGLE